MDFNTYQEKAVSTAIFEKHGQMGFLEFKEGNTEGLINFTSFVYPVLGLVGETGEIAEKIKKVIRDKQGIFEEKDLELLQKELGDVLWYLAVLAKQFDFDLQTIAEKNIEKLQSRKERDVLSGSGDER